MQYIIKGTGGQGVLFLAKVLSEALLSSGIENFSFLKEFDEGQRSGEIKVTFNLPFDISDKEMIIKDNNISELKKIVKELNMNESAVLKALEAAKPDAFKKNLKIYQEA